MKTGVGRRVRAAVILLIAVFSVVGCAGPRVSQYDPTSTSIRSIVLIRVPDHPTYSLSNNSATMIGAYGALAKQGAFDKFLRDGGFNFGQEMTQALREELERSGYEVVLAEAARKDAFTLVSDYGRVLPRNRDAILDVVAGFGVGYTTGTAFDPDYRPSFMRLYVQLVASRSREVLYGEQIKYGSPNVFVGGTAVPAPKEHFYANFGKLASGSNAVDGLRAAVKDAARYIVRRVKTGGA
jgi:hypothetical protein